MPASSNSSNTPPSSKKRGVKAEIDHDDDISDPPSTPVKKARKTAASSSPSKADAWTAEERVKLFEAYQTCAQIKWDEVAREVSPATLST